MDTKLILSLLVLAGAFPSLSAEPKEPTGLPHPCVLEPLEPWLSDTTSPVCTVRLVPDSAFPTPHEITLDSYEAKIRHKTPKEDGASYGYRYLGRTDSGTMAFLTIDSGGGSGVFLGTLFVRPATVRIGELDLSAGRPGAVTLPVSEYTGYGICLHFPCGDRTCCDFRIRGNLVESAMVDTLTKPEKGKPEVCRETIDFSSVIR